MSKYGAPGNEYGVKRVAKQSHIQYGLNHLAYYFELKPQQTEAYRDTIWLQFAWYYAAFTSVCRIADRYWTCAT